jgi:hypothetical protein
VHERAQAGALEIGLRQLGAPWIDVKRLDAAADGLGGVGQPQRGVTVGGAHLQDAPGPGGAHQHAEQRSGLGLDVAQPVQAVGLRGVVVAAGRDDLRGQGAPLGPHRRSPPLSAR